MPDSGDDAAMASVNAAIEILRLAMLHGRGRRRGGGRGGSGGAVEGGSALAQAYDDMDGRRVSPDFESGDPGNVVFGVKTVEWDPSCEIVADNLEELGVPFSKTIEGETAWFEISGENAFAARALLDGLCEHVRPSLRPHSELRGSSTPMRPPPPPGRPPDLLRRFPRPRLSRARPRACGSKSGSPHPIRAAGSSQGARCARRALRPFRRRWGRGVRGARSERCGGQGGDRFRPESIYEYEHASISGYDGLAAAAARKTAPSAAGAAEAVWKGVCSTPQEAELVHAALAAHGIAHYGQTDPETGAEEIFIAQSELDAKGYRIPRAIREMPGMPESSRPKTGPCGRTPSGSPFVLLVITSAQRSRAGATP